MLKKTKTKWDILSYNLLNYNGNITNDKDEYYITYNDIKFILCYINYCGYAYYDIIIIDPETKHMISITQYIPSANKIIRRIIKIFKKEKNVLEKTKEIKEKARAEQLLFGTEQ